MTEEEYMNRIHHFPENILNLARYDATIHTCIRYYASNPSMTLEQALCNMIVVLQKQVTDYQNKLTYLMQTQK